MFFAFLVWGGSEFQTEGPKCIVTIGPALVQWEFKETGVSTGAEGSIRRVHAVVGDEINE